MATETATGAVIYRIQNEQVQFLLLDSKDRHFLGFAKGHVEKGENYEEAALREIKEETNLEVDLNTAFQARTDYDLKNGNHKVVILYLAKLTEKEEIIPQAAEISHIEWFSYPDAYQKIKFDNLKSILKQAEHYIQTHDEQLHNR